MDEIAPRIGQAVLVLRSLSEAVSGAMARIEGEKRVCAEIKSGALAVNTELEALSHHSEAAIGSAKELETASPSPLRIQVVKGEIQELSSLVESLSSTIFSLQGTSGGSIHRVKEEQRRIESLSAILERLTRDDFQPLSSGIQTISSRLTGVERQVAAEGSCRFPPGFEEAIAKSMFLSQQLLSLAANSQAISVAACACATGLRALKEDLERHGQRLEEAKVAGVFPIAQQIERAAAALCRK
jgi:hypothetical protein